jgi:RecA-family ATPase
MPLFGNLGTNIQDMALVESIVDLATYAGVRLIVFDTLNRFSGGADENSNSAMAQVLAQFEYIASKAKVGVLIIHHSNKAASSNGTQHMQESARGAGAITANLRWQAFMQGMTVDEAQDMDISDEDRSLFVQFGGNKENYGERTPATWLKRQARGVLLPTDEVEDVIRKAKTPNTATGKNSKRGKGKSQDYDAQLQQAKKDGYYEGLAVADVAERTAQSVNSIEAPKVIQPLQLKKDKNKKPAKGRRTYAEE